MPPLAERLRLLKGADASTAAVALAAALDHAADDEVRGLAAGAIATRRGAAAAAVIRNLHRLDPAGRATLVRRGAAALWREAIGLESGGPARENVIGFVVERGDPALASTLVGLLAADEAAIRERAAGALLSLTIALAGATGRHWMPRATERALDTALAEALEQCRDHRSDEVLLAAALVAGRPGPALERLLSDEDDPVVRGVRSVVERHEEPLVQRNLLRWLTDPVLGRSAARWLHRLRGSAQHGGALARGHLLLAPARRRVLDRAMRPPECVPPLATALQLPAVAQAQLPGLIQRLPLSGRTRVRHLDALRTVPSPIARIRAVTVLLGLNGSGAAEAVHRYCLDADRAVARLAARDALSSKRPADEAVLQRIERATHTTLADRARRRLAGRSVAGFRAHRRRLAGPARRAALLALLASDAERLREELTSEMEHAEPRRRIEAIMLTRRAGLVATLEPELIELAADEDAATAATALAALATGRSPEALAALMGGIDHDNPRAMANAVESLDRAVRRTGGASRRIVEIVAPIADSEHNRPRANAVRALLHHDPDSGRELLRSMLDDRNPLHRVSGIWVARHLPAIEIAGDLQRLAGGDVRAAVRQRARTALRIIDRRVEEGATA
ncbi:MAG: hypothetical protein GY715_16505 [Planctomycetes bacterium]|nr:hypothetical protein [Planctomycetota bacterium]